MMLTERFPDLYRYLRTDATPRWLWTAGITTQIAAACWVSPRFAQSNFNLYYTFLYLQYLVLFVYGMMLVSQSILREGRERTWDAYRLAPLEPDEVVVGRLLGAPLRAWFLWLMLLPWLIAGAVTAPSTRTPPNLPFDLSQMITLAFLLHSIGILISAHSLKENLARGGFMGGVLGFFAISYSLSFYRSSAEVIWYGMALYPRTALIMVQIFLGLWAFAAACWRVGEEFLKPRRWWRVPAFILTFGLFFNGFSKYTNTLFLPLGPIMGTAVFLFVGSAINTSRADDWRQAWSRNSLWESIATGPFWMLGLIAFGLELILFLFDSRAMSHPWGLRMIMAASWLIFSARDLCLLQWFRLGKSRAPEIMAVVYIVLLYALPPLALMTQGAQKESSKFLPLFQIQNISPLDLIPGIIMLTLAGWLLVTRSIKVMEEK